MPEKSNWVFLDCSSIHCLSFTLDWEGNGFHKNVNCKDYF